MNALIKSKIKILERQRKLNMSSSFLAYYTQTDGNDTSV